MAEPDSQREADVKPAPNLKCPRCDSLETKFGYYNNYQKSQPRYFCKTCKRFWTEGGNVRDISSMEGNMGLNPATRSSSSGGINSDSSSVIVFMGSRDRNTGRVGTLNLTRPAQPAANRPQLTFTRLDINSLSLARCFNGVQNPSTDSPLGQNLPVEPNHQDIQADYSQGFPAQPESNDSSIFSDNNNKQIGH